MRLEAEVFTFEKYQPIPFSSRATRKWQQKNQQETK